jgi:uroporphyrinogen-III synthase
MNPQLAGVEILITRPADQSANLARLVRAAGGEPILFPALEIELLMQTPNAAVLDHLPQFDLVVFVSPNAVRAAMPHILDKGGLPVHAGVAAIGPGTVAELKKNGVRNIISPQAGFDSEALIGELSSLPLGGSRALIVRGEGGRELLGDALRSHGAAVTYLECYRRVKPERDMRDLLPRTGRAGAKACMATSSSIVENLFEMAGTAGRGWLCGIPFIVSHPRVGGTAFARGVQTVFVAGNGDEALVAGAMTWFARLRTPGAVS